MARGYAGVVAKIYGAQEHTITVTAIEDVTPHFRRITFHAPALLGGQPVEPAEWIRLWAPDETRPGREHMRGYTMVNPDPLRGEVSLEFVLHDPAGPACSWARNAKVGDTVAATRWACTHFALPDPAPAGYLLIGDSAALPGINAILARIPDTSPVELLLEQHHDLDRQIPLTPHPRCALTWVPGAPGALAAAIDERDWSGWYAWITCETQSTRQAKARLKELGFPKADLHGRAYWTKGKAMGTGRDTADPSAPAADPATRGRWRSRALSLSWWKSAAGS